jgi:hypothetical protein
VKILPASRYSNSLTANIFAFAVAAITPSTVITASVVNKAENFLFITDLISISLLVGIGQGYRINKR